VFVRVLCFDNDTSRLLQWQVKAQNARQQGDAGWRTDLAIIDRQYSTANKEASIAMVFSTVDKLAEQILTNKPDSRLHELHVFRSWCRWLYAGQQSRVQCIVRQQHGMQYTCILHWQLLGSCWGLWRDVPSFTLLPYAPKLVTALISMHS
jgi:hypothetical protein